MGARDLIRISNRKYDPVGPKEQQVTQGDLKIPYDKELEAAKAKFIGKRAQRGPTCYSPGSWTSAAVVAEVYRMNETDMKSCDTDRLPILGDIAIIFKGTKRENLRAHALVKHGFEPIKDF